MVATGIPDIKDEEWTPELLGELSKKKRRKVEVCLRLGQYLKEYSKILVLGIDNVGSRQMQEIRIALRGKAVLLMGKNTVMRRYIRKNLSRFPQAEQLLPQLKLNVGLLFTNGDLKEIREKILEFKVPAAAKVGAIAPVDVEIPVGPTGLDPGQTGFFQALGVSTKIVKGAIEIVAPMDLITAGDKVTASDVSLLSKLNLKPFFYGMGVLMALQDGFMFPADLLGISDEDLLEKFMNGIRFMAALSLGSGFPTSASVPHSLINGFKYLLALSLATEYTFEEAKKYKEYLENPDAFAAAAAPAGGDDKKDDGAKEEEEEEESEGGGFSMFGDDDDSD